METGSSMAAPSATASVNVHSQKLWGWLGGKGKSKENHSLLRVQGK